MNRSNWCFALPRSCHHVLSDPISIRAHAWTSAEVGMSDASHGARIADAADCADASDKAWVSAGLMWRHRRQPDIALWKIAPNIAKKK